MIVVLLLAALIGGVITFVLLWPYGLVVAVVGLPFGGSLFALPIAVGCALPAHWRARHQQPANITPAEIHAVPSPRGSMAHPGWPQ